MCRTLSHPLPVGNRQPNKKSNVSSALLHAFYIDDFLGGANSPEDAKKLITDLYTELLEYGFPLRKWSSSHPQLIQELPSELREENDVLKLFAEDYRVMTFGVSWRPNQDTFTFKFDGDFSNNQLTKRNLLSETSRLFDPMGWLSPVVIQFKILMQEICVRGLEWDQRVPDDISAVWSDLKSNLAAIHELEIPRSVAVVKIVNMQLHVFSDASERAFAAAIYSRVNDSLGNSVNLLSSKTRVAPVRTVSLPRLELCGAQLASKLCRSLLTILRPLDIEVTSYTWTDSTIVLQWLAQVPRTWSTFIAYRVS